MRAGIAALVSSRITSNVYVQKKEYGAIIETTSHVVTFDQTATNGNMLLVAVFCDSGATISTPAGYTLLDNNTGGGRPLSIFRKISVGSETGVTVGLSVAKTAVIIMFEFSGGYAGTVDDNHDISTNQSNINFADFSPGFVGRTVANDIVMAWCTMYDLTINFPGPPFQSGPFSFSNGMSQIGYAQSSNAGGLHSLEMVVGFFRDGNTSNYTNIVSLTNIDTGSFGAGTTLSIK